MSRTPPCVLFEDEDLLVVNKPTGLSTHAASPYGGEGIYEWLRHREPRWGSLAIIHRLDKETSGVLVLAKSRRANASLTEQFTRRTVGKRYLCLVSRRPGRDSLTVRSKLVRAGDRYRSVPGGVGSIAETHFQYLSQENAGVHLVQAEPITGRTHQIRVQAAESGFAILGDSLYGGAAFARVCLHAAELTLQHPTTGVSQTFAAPARFFEDAHAALREAVCHPEETDCFRLIHGAADHWPGCYVDRLGSYLLSSSPHLAELTAAQRDAWPGWAQRYQAHGIYHKQLRRTPGAAPASEASPQLVLGEAAPAEFAVRENGVQYLVSLQEGYSVGLFLDQRDNRRRVLTNHVAEGFALFPPAAAPTSVLNAFAYTCAFSVCAAKAGARTVSLDLSRRYLEWGQRNFRENGLEPAEHEFIYGDAFNWFGRLARKGRSFGLILLDPPTFSRSKEHGTFQVEKDYGRLVESALPLLHSDGVLFVSTNAASLKPEVFLQTVQAAVRRTGRRTIQQHYQPQPPDFPVSREEPAYLKTLWLRLR